MYKKYAVLHDTTTLASLKLVWGKPDWWNNKQEKEYKGTTAKK